MASRTLIWGSGSGPCWRVQVVLAEKNLKYNSRLIEFSKKEHKSPEVFAINPRGQVPAFKDGNVVVNESLAAIQYLDQAYPEPSLHGQNPQVLQRLHETNNIQTAMRGVLFAQRQQASKEEVQSKVDDLKKELNYWEEYLASSPYIAGSEFTLADVALAPVILTVERNSGTFSDFPNIAKYAAKVKSRPSVEQTTPPHWADTPKPDTFKGLL